MEEPKEIKLTIGGPRRRESINVSVSERESGEEGETLLRLEGEVDHKGRTPPQYAAEYGHLEAVKLLS